MTAYSPKTRTFSLWAYAGTSQSESNEDWGNPENIHSMGPHQSTRYNILRLSDLSNKAHQ